MQPVFRSMIVIGLLLSGISLLRYVPSQLAESTSPAADPVLDGAGEVARCTSAHKLEAAILLDSIDATVSTSGGNPNEAGFPAEYANCYQPVWDRHGAHTRLAAGNRAYYVAAFAGLRQTAIGTDPGALIPTTDPPIAIQALLETTPVLNPLDAADDIAIWIHPTDPSLSTIIGTDKKAHLEVYDLTGRVLQRIPFVTNNVDLRYNFPLGGERVALVTGVDRTMHKLFAFKVNPETRLLEDVSTPSVTPGHLGTSMYVSPVTGKYYAFTNVDSVLNQYELSDNGSGRVSVTLVRTVTFGSNIDSTEGVTADDIHGTVYVSEEAVAIWKLGAEPTDGADKFMVDKPIVKGGHFEPDIEGLTIYYKSDGTGYLIGSSQGNSTYIVYKRESNNDYLGTFAIVEGIVDGVNGTDGIDVTNFPLSSAFPFGVFIAQDGRNTDGTTTLNQNFKLVPFESIAGALNLTMDTTWDPRLVGAGSLPETSTPTPTPETPTSTPAPTVTPTHTPTSTQANGDILFLGSTSSGSVAGMPFRDEDVLAHTSRSGEWLLYFDYDSADGTEAGADLDAFARLADGSLLFSLETASRIDTLGRVDDADIIRFVPSALGINTEGIFEWYIDGSDVGLSSDDEDVDALAVLTDGRLVLSTRGSFDLPGASGADEDLVAFTPSELGQTTEGSWSLYLDGSDVGLGYRSDEDFRNLWIDPANGDIYIMTKGEFAVDGLNGENSDIFVCTPGSLGDQSSCTFGLYWSDEANGFGDEMIDNLDIEKGTQQELDTRLNGVYEPGFVNDAPVEDEQELDEDVPDPQLFLPQVSP